ARRIQFETKFSGDHDLIANWRQRFAHEFFIFERAVNLRSIEEGNAAIDGRPKKRDHLLLVSGRTVRRAHSHAPKAECRHFQISQFSLLHFDTPVWLWS